MLDLTGHWAGIGALVLFVVAYAAVIAEELLRLRKSVPVLLAAGLIWMLVALASAGTGQTAPVADAILHNLLEFAELLLFLIVAMTYVNTMEERGLFDAVRAWLIARQLSLRALFWVTGALAFIISPVADNLTTALIMGAAAVAVGRGHPRFVSLACLNVVVAANAGGVFSPFGDITTLMVWQKGEVSFFGFLPLFVPALVNWAIPAAILSLFVERGRPAVAGEPQALERGAVTVALLFLGTIATTVAMHTFLGIPSFLGMMLGLGVLNTYSYFFNRVSERKILNGQGLDLIFTEPSVEPDGDTRSGPETTMAAMKPIPTFQMLERIEWDTLMFFYGVIMSIGGLGAIGYLTLTSNALFGGLGATVAAVLIGVLSSVLDNVPLLFAVLSVDPTLSQGEWLLLVLTTGVGGSLLSVGSAAGVALMGQARGEYTFLGHLRWTWAVVLGYAASVAVHLLMNRALFGA